MRKRHEAMTPATRELLRLTSRFKELLAGVDCLMVLASREEA